MERDGSLFPLQARDKYSTTGKEMIKLDNIYIYIYIYKVPRMYFLNILIMHFTTHNFQWLPIFFWKKKIKLLG